MLQANMSGGAYQKFFQERLIYGTHGIDEMLQPLLPT